MINGIADEMRFFYQFVMLATVTAVVFIAVFFLMRYLRRARRIYSRFLCLFILMHKVDCIMIGIAYLKLIFVISQVIFMKELTLTGLIIFLLLSAAYILCKPKAGSVILMPVNVVVVAGCLSLFYILTEYLGRIRFSEGLLVAVVLLALFIIQFAVFTFCIEIRFIISSLKIKDTEEVRS